MFMSVIDPTCRLELPPVVAAQWQERATPDETAPAGVASRLTGAPEAGIGFVVTHAALSGPGVLACAPLTPPSGEWLLRVDEVAFPVGAVAHRHSHTGSGWRHLVSGALRIEAGDHVDVKAVGDNWFEPAHTPVRAVALQETGVTRFVRSMAIPMADAGRSTFRLDDPGDARLPRLQVTHRHLDLAVQVDAG